MKTIFRFLGLGLVSTAIAAAGTTAGYAQDPCADADGQTALYTKYTELYPKTTIADRKAAVEAGKQFLEKYGSCEGVKEQSDYLKAAVPKIEEIIQKAEGENRTRAVYQRFDAGIKGEKYDEAYAAGKEILAINPDALDQIIPLGAIGLVESYKKNYKYNDDALRYAKLAIEKINAGKTSAKYGVYQFQYDTKEKALGALNYAIGYINYWVKDDKKGALPYYYEASKIGATKDEPRIYATFGSYYLEQAAPLGKEIVDLIALQKGTGTDEEKLAREAVIKGKVALFNAYDERALDAFSRAYNLAKKDTKPAGKTYSDTLFTQLQAIYQRRFEKKDGLETYIASTVAKPMPNPTSPITPVADPEPAKPTTTTGAPAAVVTKPVSSVITKTSGTGNDAVKTPAAATTAVKTKPAAKKPAVRKKGTR